MKNSLLTLFLVFCSTFLFAQKYTLSGTIKDNQTNETLIGANVYIPNLEIGTTTNEYGFYSLSVPKGEHEIIISFLGYDDIVKTIAVESDTTFEVSLFEEVEGIEEVVIKSNKERTKIRKPQMSVNTMTARTIKEIPAVLGEADVVKAITLLPGVTDAGEGSSGFNVRGGAVDQNLILLDEATIFNSSHLFGLFSVFNPDAIKDLKLYKGGIPSRYGGRVSSVLDIYQKEGNSNQFHGSGGIGIVSSKLLLEGPIKKEKSSFLLAGRSSYAHLFLPLFDIDNKAYFYDLNTKISFDLNKKNKLFFSGYFGRDVFSINNSFENIYGNTFLNLRWNHLISDKLFTNISLIYSDYYYGLDLDFIGFKWNSGIKNYNLKYDLNHHISNKLKLRYGLNSVYYSFNPGEIKPSSSNSGINESKLTSKYAVENAVYIDAEHKITNNLNLQYGLRLSAFNRLGQDELYIYENDHAVKFNEAIGIYEKATPIDTLSINKNTTVKSFINLEPRIALSYIVGSKSSIKASYNRMTQYLHLLSNTSSPTPLDVWTPSGKYIKPQKLDQYAFGFYKNSEDNMYSIETEVFYKTVKNRIDYIDGADLIANNAIEQVILNGEARAYGLEFLLRKNEGRLKGWLSYTLSKSEQRTAGRNAVETGINNGNWYRTPYDKTHDISATASYKLNEKWKLNANFLFKTGLPATFPRGQYTYQGISVPVYNGRNNDRLPTYHRLDASFTYTPKPNKKEGWQSSWIFGVYNLYNRKNANSISFRQDAVSGQNEAYQLSLFGVVPSISYNFKF